MSYSSGEKKAFRIYDYHAKLLIQKLTKKNKINPNHVKDMTNLHEILNYANASFININKWDKIVRDQKIRNEFITSTKTHGLDGKTIDDYWFNLTILAILRYYWVLESSLINLLKGVKYGTKPKEKINGRETLGTFKKDVFPKLGINDHVDWKVIDTNFRNSLAHGWYQQKKDNLVYYKNAKLEEPKILTKIQLIRKLRSLYIHIIALVGEVGNWKDLEDFGNEDPLKSK